MAKRKLATRRNLKKHLRTKKRHVRRHLRKTNRKIKRKVRKHRRTKKIRQRGGFLPSAKTYDVIAKRQDIQTQSTGSISEPGTGLEIVQIPPEASASRPSEASASRPSEASASRPPKLVHHDPPKLVHQKSPAATR